MNTVLFVQVQPLIIDPLVNHQTICNLVVLLVIQLAHQLTGKTLAATHVNHAMNTVRFAQAVPRIIDPLVRHQTIYNLIRTELLVTPIVRHPTIKTLTPTHVNLINSLM
jgi:hypothetical protein